MSNSYFHKISKEKLQARIEAGELEKPVLNRATMADQIVKMSKQERDLIRHGFYQFDDETKPAELNQNELWSMGYQR